MYSQYVYTIMDVYRAYKIQEPCHAVMFANGLTLDLRDKVQIPYKQYSDKTMRS